jgi:FdhE protein
VKLRGGLPLLHGEALTFDARAAQKRGAEIATRLGDPALADAIRSGTFSLAAGLSARLMGRPEEELARVVALGLEIGAAATALRLTFFPLLVPLAAALAPLRRGTPWGRGECPTCGSAPLLGELRGLEQDRWLRCGLCASDWEFPRLACPFCDNRDHQKLSYLHVEGEEGRQRLAVCEGCGCGVKQVATLAALSPLRLLAADVATLHLDLAAAERGILTGG